MVTGNDSGKATSEKITKQDLFDALTVQEAEMVNSIQDFVPPF